MVSINHMIYTSLWYLLIGFLLGNGMPHFLFGSAGKIFRTPFGKESSPRMNVRLGLFNFILATVLVWWRLSVQSPERYDLVFLLVGFWLVIIMFGVSLQSFISDKTNI